MTRLARECPGIAWGTGVEGALCTTRVPAVDAHTKIAQATTITHVHTAQHSSGARTKAATQPTIDGRQHMHQAPQACQANTNTLGEPETQASHKDTGRTRQWCAPNQLHTTEQTRAWTHSVDTQRGHTAWTHSKHTQAHSNKRATLLTPTRHPPPPPTAAVWSGDGGPWCWMGLPWPTSAPRLPSLTSSPSSPSSPSSSSS
jgi:hypothetical protein